MTEVSTDDITQAVLENNIPKLEEYWKLCQDGSKYFFSVL
jgi:hypothetical protein